MFPLVFNFVLLVQFYLFPIFFCFSTILSGFFFKQVWKISDQQDNRRQKRDNRLLNWDASHLLENDSTMGSNELFIF